MRHSTRRKALELPPMGVYHASLKPDERIEDDLHTVMERCNDPDEQQRCLIRLINHRDRMVRDEAAERAERVSAAHARSRDPRKHLPDCYQPTIAMLQDHVAGDILKRVAEEVGYVERSRHSLTEPEEFVEKARRGRNAWARFREGVGDTALAEQCSLVIIEGKHWGKCCAAMGWVVNGRNRDKMKAAVVSGLQEAARYLGS